MDDHRRRECSRIAKEQAETTKAGAVARCWLYLEGPFNSVDTTASVQRRAKEILKRGGFSAREIRSLLL